MLGSPMVQLQLKQATDCIVNSKPDSAARRAGGKSTAMLIYRGNIRKDA